MPINRLLREGLPALAGIPIALLYGLFAYLAFSTSYTSDFLTLMACGFLLLVPLAIGALTVYLAPRPQRQSLGYVLLMPWLSCFIVLALVALLALEAIICLVMALPLLLPLASVGGLLFKLPADAPAPSPHESSYLLLIVLLPYLWTPLELQISPTDSIRTVHNQIVIEAEVEAVWAEIASVPLIQPAEQSFSPFHLVGLPKPLEATLSHEGVGGVRHATFEGGLTFVETISEWEAPYRLRFDIVRAEHPGLAKPLEQIGGAHFEVLEGRYEIEPLGNGQVRLHLSSQHRLSTRFNLYGGLWTDYIMWDLQAYILKIIKARAEAH